jgi:hypothetical protein
VKPITPAKLAAIVALVAVLFWYGSQVMQPPLPVTVQFRPTAGASDFVLIFNNESDRALSFTAALSHPGQGRQETFAVQLQPRGTYELGKAQGWVGRSGDRISLQSSHYRAWRGAIP